VGQRHELGSVAGAEFGCQGAEVCGGVRGLAVRSTIGERGAGGASACVARRFRSVFALCSSMR
jgi:hypothetical protein